MAIRNFSWVIPGKLAGSGMPGDGSSRAAFEADLAWLFREGVRCLVSLEIMPQRFAKYCADAGIEWISHPIPDFEPPQSPEDFSALVDTLIEHLKTGNAVCAHCHAGVGRTGLLLACVVGRYFSIDGRKAIETVRVNRRAIDTSVQYQFILDFCGQKA